MRRLMVALVLATLAISLWGGIAAAAPGPNSPWVITSNTCHTPSGANGHIYNNASSGKDHCFAD